LGKRGESEDSVFRRYRWQSWRLPFFGGGFYAVPYFKNGELYYQRGFGFHNAYFFAFEQGGILAFLLFMAFLIVAFRDLVRMVKHGMPEDRAFALGMLVFMIAFLPILWGGQVFWRGFGTENCNAYIVLLLVLAVTSSNPVATPRQRAQRRTPPFQPPASRALPSTT